MAGEASNKDGLRTGLLEAAGGKSGPFELEARAHVVMGAQDFDTNKSRLRTKVKVNGVGSLSVEADTLGMTGKDNIESGALTDALTDTEQRGSPVVLLPISPLRA
ncbi:hypothetical protein C0992_012516 [Termitomyces sp. T32_za158]|nr:hypothetical protein C0992_012516 [Termitomyces sp. T32_za158]